MFETQFRIGNSTSSSLHTHCVLPSYHYPDIYTHGRLLGGHRSIKCTICLNYISPNGGGQKRIQKEGEKQLINLEGPKTAIRGGWFT